MTKVNIVAIIALILLALFTDILHEAESVLAFVSLIVVLVSINVAYRIKKRRDNPTK